MPVGKKSCYFSRCHMCTAPYYTYQFFEGRGPAGLVRGPPEHVRQELLHVQRHDRRRRGPPQRRVLPRRRPRPRRRQQEGIFRETGEDSNSSQHMPQLGSIKVSY